METTVRDILAFHKMDRALYDKLLMLGQLQEVARNVIGLWMWLENIGNDVVKTIKDSDDASVLGFFEEAESILAVLSQEDDVPLPPDHDIDIPLTATLVTEPLNLRFFYCNRDVATREITYLLDSVGRLIFDNRLVALFRAYDQQGRGFGPMLPPEFISPYNTPREDSRSLFITFSMGETLRKEDIFEYFTEQWGVCVESVTLERTPPGVSPMYGRIMFMRESNVGLVLNGEQLVQFVIKGKRFWARKYVSRSH